MTKKKSEEEIEKQEGLKCVLCDARAEYLFDGISFCRRHLLKEKWNKDFTVEQKRRTEYQGD